MVRVIVQFRDKYDETRVFYPGDLLVIEDESRKTELLERGLVAEAVPQVLEKVEGTELKGKEAETGYKTVEADIESLAVAEIKTKLEEKGIKYDKRLSKEKLAKLLEEAE